MPVHWRRPEGDVLMLQTENISAGGMLLHSPQFVPPDQRIELAISLPDQREVRATAQARFVGPAENGYAIGVQFVAMASEDWKLWQRFNERLIVASLPPAGADFGDRSTANILLVSSAMSPATLATLVENGYRVNVAGDTLEALNLLRQRQDFEIMICELRRKDLDGRALCDLIKQDRSLRDVHVILLAEGDSAKDLLDGLNAGATYVVARPFSEEFFLSLIALCQRS
jgi:CheY-like chemotaxis protein